MVDVPIRSDPRNVHRPLCSRKVHRRFCSRKVRRPFCLRTGYGPFCLWTIHRPFCSRKFHRLFCLRTLHRLFCSRKTRLTSPWAGRGMPVHMSGGGGDGGGGGRVTLWINKGAFFFLHGVVRFRFFSSWEKGGGSCL